MLEECPCFPLDPLDVEATVALARRLKVDLVVIGPEAPLIRGVADALTEAAIPTFGPLAAAAQLEGSKAFAKALMDEAGVPTAKFGTFADPKAASQFARGLIDDGRLPVVKASGEALGKGVVVCASAQEADEAIRAAMVDRVFGDAGATVVIEERLSGPEFSLISLCSGQSFVSLPVAQDYKRIFDGDRGPNTGGMGSYSPVPWLGSDLVEKANEQIVRPTLAALATRGSTYRGALFSGLMMDGPEVRCLEYNVRFGDPETQSILSRIGDGLAVALWQCANGEPVEAPEVRDLAAVTVVIASRGYPETSTKGIPIEFGQMPHGVKVFHAGTRRVDRVLETAGGRVVAVTATAATQSQARDLAYEGVRQVRFEGAQHRSDIAAGV